jgi:hypothetical protein
LCLVYLIFSVLLSNFALCFAAIEINIVWNEIIGKSVTTPTLQVVVNPLLRRTSPIHDRVFEMLRNLHGDFVRFVPWLPYPRLAVVSSHRDRKQQISRTFLPFCSVDIL